MPRNCALKCFILALSDSAAAFVERLTKKFNISSSRSYIAAAMSLKALLPNSVTLPYQAFKLFHPCSLSHLCEKIMHKE